MMDGEFQTNSGSKWNHYSHRQRNIRWDVIIPVFQTEMQWTQSCLCYEQDANGMRLTEPTFVVILLLIAALLNGLKQGYLLISGGKASSNTMSSRELTGHGFLWMVR